MTANPRRRRRRTWLAVVVSFLLVGGAIALTALGVSTLRHSQEGEAVGIDERPVVTLPTTPNALLVGMDPDGALASLVVATLLPAGRGGTIVTVPVHADVNAGWTEARVSLAQEFDDVDPDDQASVDAFVASVESMLAISVEHAAVVGADELAALVDVVAPAEVTLPVDVEADGDVVLTAGDHEVSASQAAAVLTAVPTPVADDVVDPVQQAADLHALDVAVWSALGADAPAPVSETLPTTEDGAIVAPASVDELFARLWQGPVQVRDLLVRVEEDPVGAEDEGEAEDQTDAGDEAEAEEESEESPDAVDPVVVVVDRRDSLLVFAQISPQQVSTPNPTLSFRLEIGFTDEELDGSAAGYSSNSEVGRELIGALLFVQANVVSVDASTNEESTPSVTRVSVADEQFLDDMVEFSPLLFGESEVALAETLIDGVDVVVEVGTDFLARSPGETAVVVVEDAEGGTASTDVEGGGDASDDGDDAGS